MVDVFYNITPILTYVYSENKATVLSQPEAQLTCLKTVGLSVGTNATRSPGGSDHSGGVALMSGQRLGILVALLLVLTTFLTF